MLAVVAMNHSAHLTFLPAYGAEVRGGTANCQVVLSSEEIASPVCETFETIIIMNAASANRFLGLASPDALVLLNRSLCPASGPADAVRVDATNLANELGDTRVANLIMLGAYAARRNLLPVEAIEAEIRRRFESKGAAVVGLNLRAFRTGLHPT